MKVGDKIQCIKSCIMKKTFEKTTTEGKYYEICKIDEKDFYIYDDQTDLHSFSLKDTFFFNTKKLERKEKLKKLIKC